MSEPIAVMITGIGGGGHGEQILKALKMSEKRYRIIGCDMSAYSKGLAEVDVPYLLPPASAPDYIDRLLEIARKHQVKALFHGSEPELKVMSKSRDRIQAEGILLPINPASVIDTCMDKFETIRFLQEHGFRYPKTVQVKTHADLDKVDFVPAVLKPSVGGGGSANIMLAQTLEELKVFGTYLLTLYDEFIVQEYVGTPEDEYTVGVLSTMDGELINSIGIRRYILSSLSNRIKVQNRTGRQELGKVLAISSGVSQGDIGRFPEITAQCEEIAKALGSCGAINIQCRVVNGKVYVFEINPRFSGTTSLRAMVGYNEPDVLIRKHIYGEPVQAHFPYKEGVIMRGLSETYFEKGLAQNA